MNLLDLTLIDLLGVMVGFTLTIFTLSYIWGDNLLFRIATHLFIGVAAGYVAVITIDNVILPRLIDPIFSEQRSERLAALIFLVLGALLLTKVSPRLANLGNPAMAFLVGIGAAAAIGGAVTGTILPQSTASIQVFDQHENFLNALIILLGALTTLIYFHFGMRQTVRSANTGITWLQGVGYLGQMFIAITFGALFTGVYLAALTALIERLLFLWTILRDLFLSLA